jgi:hypothetical protein
MNSKKIIFIVDFRKYLFLNVEDSSQVKIREIELQQGTPRV